MENIGLSMGELSSLIVALKVNSLKEQEGAIQADSAQFIKEGCTEGEARFRAEIIRGLAIDASSIMQVIDQNNKRILFDLKEALALKP